MQPARRAPNLLRRARLLPVLVTLLASLGLAFAQAPSGYYPATPGLAWTYDNGETQSLSGPIETETGPRMRLTHAFDGVPVSEEILSFEPDGSVLHHGTAAGGTVMPYDPPLLVYPAPPLEPGDTWQSSTRVGGVDVTLATDVLGLLGVATPAGRFNALHLRQTTLTSTGGRTILDLFYVPTVGIVRFVTQDGTTIDLIERIP